ncbi:MAG: hypothetical protein AAGG51_23340 [Cyanobacteria bacterium P01_G01_bin.54]
MSWLLLVTSCLWAFLTGIFFSLPTLSPLVGGVALLLAVSFGVMTGVLPKLITWIACGITLAMTLIVSVFTGFSVINYAVASTLILNFVLFGQLGEKLSQRLSVKRSSAIVALLFSGSLGLGWLLALLGET